MSLESLLESLLEVPPVPEEKNSGEPPKPNEDGAGTPGSPSSPEINSLLDNAINNETINLDIKSTEIRNTLDTGDIEKWNRGKLTTSALVNGALIALARLDMDRGTVPIHFTKRAYCEHCGPIWLWIAGEVTGCPWCRNRRLGKPIPRPCSVKCGGCVNFKRMDHPHLGHCTKGQAENVAGLWDGDHRYCEQYLPRSRASSNISLKSTQVDKS